MGKILGRTESPGGQFPLGPYPQLVAIVVVDRGVHNPGHQDIDAYSSGANDQPVVARWGATVGTA